MDRRTEGLRRRRRIETTVHIYRPFTVLDKPLLLHSKPIVSTPFLSRFSYKFSTIPPIYLLSRFRISHLVLIALFLRLAADFFYTIEFLTPTYLKILEMKFLSQPILEMVFSLDE
jgi:hypothetical protein